MNSTSYLADFAPIAESLARGVTSHLEARGRATDPDGSRTIETNSTLVPGRAIALTGLLRACGVSCLRGQRVLDAGAGFGGLACYFAHLGASVVALDPNPRALGVVASVAAAHDLDITTVAAGLEDAALPDGTFDAVVLNNSLCYLGGEARARGLASVRAVLASGGHALVREPNRAFPLEPFTSLPLVQLLPATIRSRIPGRGGDRAALMTLRTPRQLRRELRGARLVPVARGPIEGLGRYFELAARAG